MGKRRSMMRKKKYDDAYKRQPTRPWSNLTHDVLFLVMMQLGVIDFLAFGGVCKLWRSLTISNKNKFMVSRPPMYVFVSTDANEKMCYLEDSEGREFKTILPYYAKRTCIGVTCGYLILFGDETRDFLLVSPFTRHEFHFPEVPSVESYPFPKNVDANGLRATLVFSPSISGWVLVVFGMPYDIWFCIAGKTEWNVVSSPFTIDDFIAFMGKIYTLHFDYDDDYDVARDVWLYEMKFFPEPKLVLLEIKNFKKPHFDLPRFATSGENLYVLEYSKLPSKIHELDVDEMKWVSRENKGEEYVFFDRYQCVLDISLYEGKYKSGNYRVFYANIWYFFHDFLNVDLLHE